MRKRIKRISYNGKLIWVRVFETDELGHVDRSFTSQVYTVYKKVKIKSDWSWSEIVNVN